MAVSALAQAAHDAAVNKQAEYYIDPETGYRVFTTLGLRQRGDCCGSKCRHCPFQHKNVPPVLMSEPMA